MDQIAALLWNPFLCLVYLVIGVLLTAATGAAAWRRWWPALLEMGAARGQADDRAQIEHKDAFLSTLSASVGVGNLAGVATALHLGGPGARHERSESIRGRLALLGVGGRLDRVDVKVVGAGVRGRLGQHMPPRSRVALTGALLACAHAPLEVSLRCHLRFIPLRS